jgi:hypothetical protein
MTRYALGHYIGFGEVAFATDGAAADITTWFRGFDSTDQMQFDRPPIEIKDFTKWGDDRNVLFPGRRSVTGSVTIQPTFGYLQNLLRGLTGHNVTVSGVGPYTYAFVPVDFNSSSHYLFGTTLRGFAIESYRGTSGESTFYHGCVPTSFEFRFPPGEAAELTINFIGRKYTNEAKSTPTFKNDFMVTATGQTANLVSLASTERVTRACTFTVNHALEARYDITDIDTLTPFPTGKRETTLQCEIDTDDDGNLDRIEAPLTSRYQTNTVKLEQQGDSTVYLLITLPDLVVRAPAEARLGNLGVVTTALNLKAYANGATPEYSITLVNDDTNYAT